jgi:hypothetical protein
MFRKIRRTYYRIRRVLDYIPVLWEDREFDWTYLCILLRKKLQRMEKFFREDAWTASKDIDSPKIHECILLLDRIIADDYEQDLNKPLDYMIKQDIHRLFGIMEKNLRCWWD